MNDEVVKTVSWTVVARFVRKAEILQVWNDFRPRSVTDVFFGVDICDLRGFLDNLWFPCPLRNNNNSNKLCLLINGAEKNFGN